MSEENLAVLEQVGSFNPAIPGTCESRWNSVLASAGEWLPGSRPLVVISPHPDDEVLAAGGLMRLHALAGLGVTVLSVTDGAAAYPDWPGLDAVRRGELGEALRVLAGSAIELVHLGIPDGRVDAYRMPLYDAVTHHCRTRPILVAPYEFDGHPDHDAVGAVCLQVARRQGLTVVRYPVWTWHHAAPAALSAVRWGRVLLDPATLLAKVQAIECFNSQLRPVNRPPIVPQHVLNYFKRTYEAFLL